MSLVVFLSLRNFVKGGNSKGDDTNQSFCNITRKLRCCCAAEEEIRLVDFVIFLWKTHGSDFVLFQKPTVYPDLKTEEIVRGSGLS